MTTRAPKSTAVLTVGQAFDKIRERFRTQPERELAHARAFLAAEAEWHGKVASCVPESERGTLARMLDAPAPRAHDVASVSSPAIVEHHDAGAVTVTRCTDDGLPIGATPYTPGPVAQAATERRR